MMGIAINCLLERGVTQAPPGIDKTFSRSTPRKIGSQNPLYGLNDLIGRKRRSEAFANGTIVTGSATEGQLVPVFVTFFYAKDADMSEVVMAAGVDAARHLQ